METADRSRAEDLVRWPALVLLVAGAADLVFSLYMSLAGDHFNAAMLEWIKEQEPDLDTSAFEGMSGTDPVTIALTAVGFALTLLTIFGAWRMLKLRSWGLALTAAILSMIPCCGICCGLTLPIGIWAVIVLNKAEVRSAFR